MATVIGGIGISHTPSMGVEYDRGMAAQDGFSPRWQPWYDGTRRVEELLVRLAPDHLVVVYNDHLNYFDLDNYPALAIGVGERFRQADEGWGPRDLPDLAGDTRWGVHLTEQLTAREFDLTVSQDLAIDHGVFSWLPYVFRRTDGAWPVTVTPIAVNMVRQPLPAASRLRSLGAAIRASVEAFPGAERVLVIATGGMSHQISGGRFGMANEDLDRYFLARLPDHLDELAAIPVREYMRLGGTDAAELILWFAMRAALSARARPVYTFQAVPSITGCGALVMAEPGALDDTDLDDSETTQPEVNS
ncbi:protocatechuate 3,4-dioxygenase [Trebonia kvetii]|uniref:Protocatechuate 3,4-dioxygenase n=1 Tax=Trebonia kvetii TaxID=2480626 RepID=A0A6P2BZI6_9ACTN|nr:protocatechuate 3,4-dioxygenase [Trebonia kvetii]TVZ04504.1 protocatechuate 3,4-dioxygenase [Trebonia kvetii]